MDTSNQTNLKAVQEVLRAARFACEKHTHQKRKGAAAEPYLNHLIEVAHLVSISLTEPDTSAQLSLAEQVAQGYGVFCRRPAAFRS